MNEYGFSCRGGLVYLIISPFTATAARTINNGS